MSAALCLLALLPSPGADWPAAGLLAAEKETRLEAAAALAARGPAARDFAPLLLERIAAPETEPARYVMETGEEDRLAGTVRALGADAVPAILAALAADDPDLRAAGVAVQGPFWFFSDWDEQRIAERLFHAGAFDRVAELEAAQAKIKQRDGSGGPWKGERALIESLRRADPSGERAVPALLGAVESLGTEPETGTERAWVVNELGWLGAGATKAIEPVRGRLSDESPDVRAAAARALAMIRQDAGPTDEDAETVGRLLGALTDGGGYMVSYTPDMSGTEPVAAAVAEALLAFPEHAERSARHAVRVLAVFVPPRPERVRGWGTLAPLAALAAQHEPSAKAAADLLGPRLFETKEEAEWVDPWWTGLREGVPEAIAALGPVAAGLVPQIEPLLTDADANRRLAGAELFAAVAPDHPALIPTLRALIEENPEGVEAWEGARDKALQIAASLGERAAPLLPAVLATLEEVWSGGDVELNRYAADVVAAIGPAAVDAAPILVRHLDSVLNWESSEALLAIGPAALPHVAAAARGEWPEPPPEWRWEDERRAALELLGSFGPAAAPYAEPLLAAAADPAAADRERLLEAVAELNVPDLSLSVLLAAAADADPFVRAAVARGLRGFPDELDGARDTLARLAADEYATVRLPAAVTLKTLAPDHPALNRLKTDPNPAVRLAAE